MKPIGKKFQGGDLALFLGTIPDIYMESLTKTVTKFSTGSIAVDI
jgi:hypothetical protein